MSAVVITATETGICREVLYNGSYAIDGTLALEYRVNGITAASSAAPITSNGAASAAGVYQL